ncbi:MAG: hypothetical protein HOE90_15030 [Bacteriovoracaceae bacterium]|nr:hypothetical protein [Bacteriovoracaceae bacterium]
MYRSSFILTLFSIFIENGMGICPESQIPQGCVDKVDEICQEIDANFTPTNYFEQYLSKNEKEVERTFKKCQKRVFGKLFENPKTLEEIENLDIDALSLSEKKDLFFSSEYQRVLSQSRSYGTLDTSVANNIEIVGYNIFDINSSDDLKNVKIEDYKLLSPYLSYFSRPGSYPFISRSGAPSTFEKICESSGIDEVSKKSEFLDEMTSFGIMHPKVELIYSKIVANCENVVDGEIELSHIADVSEYFTDKKTITYHEYLSAIKLKYSFSTSAETIYRNLLKNLKSIVQISKMTHSEYLGFDQKVFGAPFNSMIGNLHKLCGKKIKQEYPLKDSVDTADSIAEIRRIFNEDLKSSLKKIVRSEFTVMLNGIDNIPAALSPLLQNRASSHSIETIDKIIDDMSLATFTGEPTGSAGKYARDLPVDSTQAFYANESNSILLGYQLIKDFKNGYTDNLILTLSHEMSHAIGKLMNPKKGVITKDGKKNILSPSTFVSYKKIVSICQQEIEKDSLSFYEDLGDFFGANLSQRSKKAPMTVNSMAPLIHSFCHPGKRSIFGAELEPLKKKEDRIGFTHSMGQERILRLLYLGLEFDSIFVCDPKPSCNAVLK